MRRISATLAVACIVSACGGGADTDPMTGTDSGTTDSGWQDMPAADYHGCVKDSAMMGCSLDCVGCAMSEWGILATPEDKADASIAMTWGVGIMPEIRFPVPTTAGTFLTWAQRVKDGMPYGPKSNVVKVIIEPAIPEDPCATVACPDGQTCHDGTCEGPPPDPCATVVCPSGQMCQDGTCQATPDPCAEYDHSLDGEWNCCYEGGGCGISTCTGDAPRGVCGLNCGAFGAPFANMEMHPDGSFTIQTSTETITCHRLR